MSRWRRSSPLCAQRNIFRNEFGVPIARKPCGFWTCPGRANLRWSLTNSFQICQMGNARETEANRREEQLPNLANSKSDYKLFQNPPQDDHEAGDMKECLIDGDRAILANDQ